MSHTSSRTTKVRRPVRSVHKVPRNRKKPNYKLLLGLFGTSVLIACAVSFSCQAPALAIKEVNITGVSLADKTAVRNAGHLALGRNIFLLRKSPIIARIRRLDEVAQVKVGRSFPNKVWIELREKSGRGNYRYQGLLPRAGRWADVPQGDGPVNGLMLIEVARPGPIRPGVKSDSQSVRGALEVLSSVRRQRLQVSKISVNPVGDICLNMEGGCSVILGQPEDIAQKVSMLRRTLVYRPSIAREAAYIDLSCPSAAVWKPKTIAGAAS